MRTSPLILLLLLISQLALPYNSCQAGESCHGEEIETVEETRHCHNHDMDAASTDHPCDTEHEEKEDCADCCSCNCCRVVVNLPIEYAALPLSLNPHSNPASWLNAYLFELSEAIWQPPRMG